MSEQPSLIKQNLTVNDIQSSGAGALSGTIVNGETGEPIMGANIVWAEGTIGTSTDREGKFALNHLPSVVQEFVISYIGFKSVSFQVKVQ